MAGDDLFGRILVIASSVLKAGKKFFRQKELVRSGGFFTIIEASRIPITGIGAGKISAAITGTSSGWHDAWATAADEASAARFVSAESNYGLRTVWAAAQAEAEAA